MNKLNKLAIAAATALTFALATPAVNADSDAKLAQMTISKSYSDAESIALKETTSGRVTDMDLKIKSNNPVYDVTVVDGNKETKLRIDANTGKILKTEIETDNDQENQTLGSTDTKADFSAIEKAAKKDYPNATIDSIELEVKQNSVYYKVDLIDGTQEIEVTYSADDASKQSEQVEFDD